MSLLPRLLSLATTLLLWLAPVHATERILDYHSDIRIEADGSMMVDEQIRVQAEGNAIKHGIYRDFPTDYRDRFRNRVRIDFEVLGVQRDGRAEAWHTERRSNGTRVYMGDKTSHVARGEHTYVIRYRTARQLVFLDEHDELYWNVTGTGWPFIIDKASATVHLPQKVAPERLKALGFTGSEGSTAQNLDTQILADGAHYQTTRLLAPQQNLTVVLSFPKGIVAEPDFAQKSVGLLKNNRNLLLGLLGLALLWLYYTWAWNRFGRDPESGPLVARYQAPRDASAAALRYVRRMGYDQTCFTAGVLGLAARGRLQIKQGTNDTYTLEKSATTPDDTLPRDSRKLFESLFAKSSQLALKSKNHTRVKAALNAHKAALSLAYEKKYFFTNSVKLWPGVLISLAALGAMMIGVPPEAWFMLFWLSIWSVGVFVLVSAIINTGNTTNFKGVAAGIGSWLFAIPFLIGEVAGLGVFGHLVGYAMLPLFVLLLGTNVAFYHWMKAPTQDGAKLLDGIDGFRWYLGVAEKQELDSRYRPEAAPELFGHFLPYAVALDVGNAWAERFASALTPVQMQQARPTWYHGTNMTAFNATTFASLGSNISSGVGGAIASSSRAPGSSSGSSGGGFSGGGGGGGGGGGW